MITLKEHYKTSVVPELKEKLGLDSVMAVPKVTKITINMGVGEALNDKKVLESAVEDMTLIAGQKPLVTKARKSVANFKICLLYTSPSPRDPKSSRMPSSA